MNDDTTRIRFSRATSDARTALAAQFRAAYENGAAVRSIAEKAGRSYGFVHRILAEAGVAFRARGGGRPRCPADESRTG
ncbi:helix-turn-helix domain-containing protein [Streptomyces sp. x-80]|uniref:helix-turn-helix domain-containing protein n=1 Tax=Streptomyces sp. x-80 TaxID=2789282 RepID=UPI003980D18B